MDHIEFTALLIDNIPLYCGIFLGVLVFMFVFLRKKITSLIDPFFLTFLFAVFANSVAVFLYYLNEISDEKFCFFCVSESLFWLGFLCLSKKRVELYDSSRESMTYHEVRKFFLLALFCVIVLQLICYAIGGIPLLSESRFSARQNPIVAILERMMNFPKLFCWVFAFHLLLDSTKLLLRKVFAGATILVLVIFSLLSGSKGFILQAIFGFFVYSYFYCGKTINLKITHWIAIILSPVIVTYFYYGTENVAQGLMLLLYRFVASGDVYWTGFGYDVVDHIDNTAYWYERVFSFILGPLGLISENAKIPIGTLILNEIEPGTIGTLEGPNARMPVFSWVCFGNLGVLFSFISGMLCSFLAYRPPLSVPYSLLGASLIGMVYKMALSIPTDFGLAMSGLIDILFAIILINCYSFFFCKSIGQIKLLKIVYRNGN